MSLADAQKVASTMIEVGRQVRAIASGSVNHGPADLAAGDLAHVEFYAEICRIATEQLMKATVLTLTPVARRSLEVAERTIDHVLKDDHYTRNPGEAQ